MSKLGQKRRFASLPAISGLPRTTDIIVPAQLIRFVPATEVAASLDQLVGSNEQAGWYRYA